MRHPIYIPSVSKLNLSRYIDDNLRTVDFARYGNEPNYTPAMIQALNNLVYEDDSCKVVIEGAVMVGVASGAAEKWSGADCSVVATISQGDITEVKKAILIQSKRGSIEDIDKPELERLKEQIKDMQALTKNPKVLEVPTTSGGIPTIVSGTGIQNQRRLQHQSLGNWIAKRVLPTFDGDTRPFFVDAVLDANLSKLKIYARVKEV